MKSVLMTIVFMLATLAWAAAQQPGSAPDSSGQATSPSSQAPGASQSQQPSTPGGAGQAEPQNQAPNAPVTEGCLGGSNPNYTVTDTGGTTYKLNIPPNADASKLGTHVGESVQVLGDVKDAGKTGNASIDVQGIRRGTGKCPGSTQTPATPPAPPKQ
jgi:hypothetical protein